MAPAVVAEARFEYGPLVPKASWARTRYVYLVDAASPRSGNVVVTEVPTFAKLLQPAPWQRSIRYRAILPPDSAAAPQDRSISALPFAAALNPEGAVGVGVPPPLPGALKLAI